MKKILFSLIAMMIATVSLAQTNLVATLTHGDDIKMFYGAFAFQNAHNAAEHGDIINLSGGNFQSVQITKALTIRGAGVDDATPTYITGNFRINIPADVTERLSFEGCRITNDMIICGTLKNAYFTKSILQSINYDNTNIIVENATFANCQIFNIIAAGSTSLQFVNSHIENFNNNYTPTKSSASFVNCVVIPQNGYGPHIASSQLTNCIICFTSGGISLPSTSSAFNCVAVGNNQAFNNVLSKQNCQIADVSIFKDSSIWGWADLTDEAKTKYLGNDGTPIGMHGGILPYNMTPSYPQVTKMNIAKKTTADGKLSVDIEVSAVQ